MVSVEAVHVPILVHNGLRYPSLARRRRPDQRRELRDGGVEMPKLSRDFVLPVVAAVLGTIAILCVLLVVVFVCTRTRRATRTAATLKTTATTSASSSSNNPATAPMSRSGGSATLVVQRDTSSIVSASDSVAPPSVPFTPSFRRAQSSDAQSSIYENFGGRSPALNSRGYPADDDFDDVWSYAMVREKKNNV
jgi:hypothetical protein